ncbi:anti-sigma factor antagonist [Bacillus sp. SA1-12]|uniref:STAS domain-containing protein n=1 Tax=Bacillus sp. SA1-12 TaxID=1455638 RepID=UPI000625E45F|nr:STAS domain-containing protein [Bacillus sp. SA1-12]KKI93560.1 anti-sigma factor antagonist [Bacillus sp. SA1-12]
MDTTFSPKENINEFIIENRHIFQEKLLSEAVTVATKINDILQTGNINLLENAEKLSLYVVENKEEQLTKFAQQEGVIWAKHALTLAFKLEWVQAIRRTIWHFLYHFDELNGNSRSTEDFFDLEKMINNRLDKFINNFFISYSNYKDDLIKSQRKLVEHLSVPIIPVSKSVAVLPLIGMIDGYRIKIIEERALIDISNLRIQRLIMDMSGIADMEIDVMDHFIKVLNAISMMGCKAVLTGLRPELVRKMVHAGISFDEKAETNGTLQQTLKEYLAIEQQSY